MSSLSTRVNAKTILDSLQFFHRKLFLSGGGTRLHFRGPSPQFIGGWGIHFQCSYYLVPYDLGSRWYFKVYSCSYYHLRSPIFFIVVVVVVIIIIIIIIITIIIIIIIIVIIIIIIIIVIIIGIIIIFVIIIIIIIISSLSLSSLFAF